MPASAPDHHVQPDAADTAYTPVEYRIAIADACECSDYRDTVLESGSNTNGAIYYRKPHLEAIVNTLTLPTTESPTCGELRARIRQRLTAATADAPKNPSPVAADGGLNIHGQSQLSTDRFTFEELVALSDVVGTEPDTPYIEPELRRLAGSSIAGPYLAELTRNAYVDLYLSISVGNTTAEYGSRGYYPYRFEPVNEIPDSATSHPDCYHYVVDSAIGHPEYGNQEALDTAARVDADAAVLADVYQDLDVTVAAVLDGLALYDSHEFSGELIIPLQPPHDDCYRQLRDRGVSPDHTFALGGLKDCNDDTRKLNAARAVRDEATTDITLHGLGYGVTDQIARAIRDEPALLDSIDYSTPGRSSIDTAAEGEKRLCSVAAQAGAALIEDLRRISPFVTQDSTTATTLSDY